MVQSVSKCVISNLFGACVAVEKCRFYGVFYIFYTYENTFVWCVPEAMFRAMFCGSIWNMWFIVSERVGCVRVTMRSVFILYFIIILISWMLGSGVFVGWLCVIVQFVARCACVGQIATCESL